MTARTILTVLSALCFLAWLFVASVALLMMFKSHESGPPDLIGLARLFYPGLFLAFMLYSCFSKRNRKSLLLTGGIAHALFYILDLWPVMRALLDNPDTAIGSISWALAGLAYTALWALTFSKMPPNIRDKQ